mmetsp:Transcript_51375/g.137409  ORF Transcript_51375/g.137409 Transcript_51375/m.137409 type:complete len:203 (+) Transcript_51375:9-617(+)
MVQSQVGPKPNIDTRSKSCTLGHCLLEVAVQRLTGCDSECEDTLLRMPQLLEVGQAGVLQHGRRAAHKRHRVLVRREKMIADHVLIYEALAVAPLLALGHAVHGVPDLEAVGVLLGHELQLLLRQDVVRRLVRVEQADLRLVGGVPQDRGRHLVAGGEARAAGYQRDALDTVFPASVGEHSLASVDDLAKGSLHVDGVAYLQ